MNKFQTAISNAKTPEAAARAVAAWMKSTGSFSELEIWTPERTQELGWGNGWSICCEGGPYEWTIAVSGNACPFAWNRGVYSKENVIDVFNNSGGWLAEPYNHFVLNFNKL